MARFRSRAGRICREGEWWLLGPHRVHCGGELDPAACATLMAEQGNQTSPSSVCVCVTPARADELIRQWQKLTGEDARHSESGESFNNLVDSTIAIKGD